MAKSWLPRNLDKLIWPAVIGMMASVLTALILSWIQNKSSDIVVRQFYNTVEEKAVPKQVGGQTNSS